MYGVLCMCCAAQAGSGGFGGFSGAQAQAQAQSQSGGFGEWCPDECLAAPAAVLGLVVYARQLDQTCVAVCSMLHSFEISQQPALAGSSHKPNNVFRGLSLIELLSCCCVQAAAIWAVHIVGVDFLMVVGAKTGGSFRFVELAVWHAAAKQAS